MLAMLGRRIRRRVAGAFPGRLPRLYTTLDDPEQVPVQVAAYRLAVRKYTRADDSVLDVGFGLGYGLQLMAESARRLSGIEVDPRTISNAQRLLRDLPQIGEIRQYDGRVIPYNDNSFDVVTCVDVIEHVPDYTNLIAEMLRVSSRTVFISTPNRRPEYTRPNGRPKNQWHLREWCRDEFATILTECAANQWIHEWNFIDGPWEGPFTYSAEHRPDTLALAPALLRKSK